MIKNIKMLLLVSLTFAACTTKEDEVVVDNNSSDNLPLTSGTANFSKYVALGNSLTAGFSDNALFIEGQKGAWTNVLAEQFKLVGGGVYKTPFMNDNIGGLLFLGNANPRFGPRLFFNGAGPAPVSGTSTTEVFAPNTGGPYNNMGVPGAKSFHLLSDGYGNPANLALGLANPYFVRFASAPNKSILQDAMAQTPTFFSLWIGNNDILGYATAGGVTSAQDPVNGGDITPPSGVPGVGFDGTYTALVTTLTSGGAKGVVANIPNVTSIPYFTTVPYNPVTIDAATAAALNGATAYGAYNAGLLQLKNANLITEAERAKRTITFVAGAPNPVVLIDESLQDLTPFNPGLTRMRQATAKDLLVLPSRSFIGTTVGGNAALVNGVSVPLADKWVLTEAEVLEIKTATDAYNVTIAALAASKNLAFLDANKLLNQVATTGIAGNGFLIKSTYVTGGAFSLDGVHPSPRGYALIANEFIKVINAKYGSNLKGVDLSKYRIMFPSTL
jgi:lysophospholipase L1-like esterase